MVATRPHVELLEKNKPRQERAKRTYEAILNAAGELLVEVGVERISTNLIAERAGITVPALYRYFPNKYAVLNALGAALIEKQNAAFKAWFEMHMGNGGPEVLLENVYDLLLSTFEVTREQTGGLEILQALRAVAPLQEGRLATLRLVVDQFSELVSGNMDRPADEDMKIAARLIIESGYAVVEMALADDSINTELFLQQASVMLRQYWKTFSG